MELRDAISLTNPADSERDGTLGVQRRAAAVRFWRTVLVTWLLISIPAVVAVWWLQVPVYEARVTVLFRHHTWIIYPDSDESRPMYGGYLRSQMEIMTSPQVLQRVLDRSDVQKTRWYNDGRRFALGKPPSRLERLCRDLAFEVRPPQLSIELTMRCRDPAEAQLIVNAVVGAFLGLHMESELDALDMLREALQRELEKCQAEIDELLKQLGDSGARIVDGEVDSKQHDRRLGNARERLAELELQIAVTRKRLEPACATVSTRPADSGIATQPTTERLYATDPDWLRLRKAFLDARQAVESAQARFGPLHPKSKELRETVERLRKELTTREEELEHAARLGERPPDASTLDEALKAASVEALLSQLIALESEASALREEIERQERRFREQLELIRELADLKNCREMVEWRLEELEMQEKSFAAGDKLPPPISGVQPAKLPFRPVIARQRVFGIGAAALAGLPIGLIVAVVRSRSEAAPV